MSLGCVTQNHVAEIYGVGCNVELLSIMSKFQPTLSVMSQR